MPKAKVNGKEIEAASWEELAKLMEAMGGGTGTNAPPKKVMSFDDYVKGTGTSGTPTPTSKSEGGKLLRDPKRFFESLVNDPEEGLKTALKELLGYELKAFMEETRQLALMGIHESRNSRFEDVVGENEKLDRNEAARVLDAVIKKDFNGAYTRSNLKAALKKAYENEWLPKPDVAKPDVKTDAQKPELVKDRQVPFHAPVELMDLQAEGELTDEELGKKIEKFAASADLDKVEELLSTFNLEEGSEEAEALFSQIG